MITFDTVGRYKEMTTTFVSNSKHAVEEAKRVGFQTAQSLAQLVAGRRGAQDALSDLPHPQTGAVAAAELLSAQLSSCHGASPSGANVYVGNTESAQTAHSHRQNVLQMLHPDFSMTQKRLPGTIVCLNSLVPQVADLHSQAGGNEEPRPAGGRSGGEEVDGEEEEEEGVVDLLFLHVGPPQGDGIMQVPLFTPVAVRLCLRPHSPLHSSWRHPMCEAD